MLSNTELRQRYDKYGDIDERQQGFGTGINIEDLFNGAFGGGFPGFGDFGFNSANVVENISQSIIVDFMEAAKGCEKEISVNRISECGKCDGNGSKNGTSLKECEICGGQGRTMSVNGNIRMIQTCSNCMGAGHFVDEKCHECNGEGTIGKQESLKVSIPAGIDHGTRLRLKGKGRINKSGRAGDLILLVNVRRHPVFSKVGRDIKSEYDIDYLDAVLGTEKSIETIWGDKKIKIPAGTQPNTIFKIDGHGIKKQGDHLVKIIVKIPKKINSEQRKVLERLRKNG